MQRDLRKMMNGKKTVKANAVCADLERYQGIL